MSIRARWHLGNGEVAPQKFAKSDLAVVAVGFVRDILKGIGMFGLAFSNVGEMLDYLTRANANHVREQDDFRYSVANEIESIETTDEGGDE